MPAGPRVSSYGKFGVPTYGAPRPSGLWQGDRGDAREHNAFEAPHAGTADAPG